MNPSLQPRRFGDLGYTPFVSQVPNTGWAAGSRAPAVSDTFVVEHGCSMALATLHRFVLALRRRDGPRCTTIDRRWRCCGRRTHRD